MREGKKSCPFLITTVEEKMQISSGEKLGTEEAKFLAGMKALVKVIMNIEHERKGKNVQEKIPADLSPWQMGRRKEIVNGTV